MKIKLTDQQEKIRELLYGEPKEKLLALLLMSDTEITFDTDDFDEDMIERDHCTC